MRVSQTPGAAIALLLVASCGPPMPEPDELAQVLGADERVELALPTAGPARSECTPCVAAATRISLSASVPENFVLWSGFSGRLIREYLVPRGILEHNVDIAQSGLALYLPVDGAEPGALTIRGDSAVAVLAQRSGFEVLAVEPLADGWESTDAPAAPFADLRPPRSQLETLIRVLEGLREVQLAGSTGEVRVDYRYDIESTLPGLEGNRGSVESSAVLFRNREGAWERLVVPEEVRLKANEVEEVRLVMQWMDAGGAGGG